MESLLSLDFFVFFFAFMTSQLMIPLRNQLSIVWDAKDMVTFGARQNDVALIETSYGPNRWLITNAYTLLEVIETLSAPDVLAIVILSKVVHTTSLTFT